MNGALDNLTTHPTPERRTADRMLLSGGRSLPAENATPTSDRRWMVGFELIDEKRPAETFVRYLGLKKRRAALLTWIPCELG